MEAQTVNDILALWFGVLMIAAGLAGLALYAVGKGIAYLTGRR